jgi:hypothetical protein
VKKPDGGKKRHGKKWVAQRRKNTENKIMNENSQNQNGAASQPAAAVDAVGQHS